MLRFCWRGWLWVVVVVCEGRWKLSDPRAQAEEGAPLPTYVYVGVWLVRSWSGHRAGTLPGWRIAAGHSRVCKDQRAVRTVD